MKCCFLLYLLFDSCSSLLSIGRCCDYGFCKGMHGMQGLILMCKYKFYHKNRVIRVLFKFISYIWCNVLREHNAVSASYTSITITVILIWKFVSCRSFRRVWNATGSAGRGFIGVCFMLRRNEDKQGFERSIVLTRVETGLIQNHKTHLVMSLVGKHHT